jgi:hypothetical protein
LLKTQTIHLKSGKISLGSLEIRSSALKPVYVRSGKRQEWLGKAISNAKAQSSKRGSFDICGFWHFGLGYQAMSFDVLFSLSASS